MSIISIERKSDKKIIAYSTSNEYIDEFIAQRIRNINDYNVKIVKEKKFFKKLDEENEIINYNNEVYITKKELNILIKYENESLYAINEALWSLKLIKNDFQVDDGTKNKIKDIIRFLKDKKKHDLEDFIRSRDYLIYVLKNDLLMYSSLEDIAMDKEYNDILNE